MRVILAIAFLSVKLAFGAEGKFPASAIPDSLKKKANAVVRVDSSVVVINSPGSVLHKVFYAVTVMNAGGDEAARLVANYDRLQKVGNIKGALYNEKGEQLKRLRNSEIQDLSAISQINFDDDSRMKTHHFMHHQYPYTVEYSYEIIASHTFYLPVWFPQNNPALSVQNSSYEIVAPKGFHIRYKALNTGLPQESGNDKQKSLKWSLRNKPVRSGKNFFTSWRDTETAVFVAVNDFQLEQLKGNMETWREFGRFQYGLIRDKDVLPAGVKEKVREMCSGANSRKEKIAILYNYLQKNTRYISIQLGIGGWEPFNAEYVAQKGYGDCKALTNYMKALLSEAGIISYYTLVNAGDGSFARNRVLEDFPSQQFNHVILAVPLSGDTTWLECTSQSLPVGYLSGFTANRTALLIREDGGYLVATPRFSTKENMISRKAVIELHENGIGNGRVDATYTGLEQDIIYGFTKSAQKENVVNMLSNSLSVSNFNLVGYSYHFAGADLPAVTEELRLELYNFAHVTGKRLFVSPNIFSRSDFRIDEDSARILNYLFENGYRISDTMEISVPKGYVIETPIKPVAIRTRFADYHLQFAIEDGKVKYQRSITFTPASVDASEQKSVNDFFNTVNKADRMGFVLLRPD